MLTSSTTVWSNTSTAHAFSCEHSGVWDTVMADLNDSGQVQGLSGAVLEQARAVNQAGYIVCNGTVNGQSKAFLLVPLQP